MTKEKRYEILRSLPTYGPMYIPVTNSEEAFYSEGFPVRFYKTDGTEWVANFQPGWTDLKQIIEFKKTENFLVIACGTFYIMNPNNTIPIQVFGVGYCDIFQASNDRLVLQDQTELTIIEPNGTHWDTERISWDGLAEVKVENNLVSGLAYNPMQDADEWIEFKYDLDTKTLTGGSYYSFDNKKILVEKMVTEKFACPCCGYKTFAEQPNGHYDICEVCFWEDDPIQLNDPNYEGGANRVSLRQGQRNFIEFGACERKMIKNVRQPTKDEQRDENWKILE